MEFRKPYVCWPTICVFIISILAFVTAIIIGNIDIIIVNYINKYKDLHVLFARCIICVVTIIISAFASYAQFTVTHESVHSNISKNKYLNDGIGIISALWLGPTGNWFAFRKHHLLHHKETNDIDKDPDMWCSKQGFGGEKYIFLRWLTLDLYYWYLYLFRNTFGIIENAKILTYQVFNIYIFHLSATTFGIIPVLQYWIIPSRLAILLLSFAFDYLPHYPHDITKREDRYKTTSYISCPWVIKLLLSPIAFYQDYHIIHHENPSVPFYQYSKVWDATKDKLIDKGIRINKLLPDVLGEEVFF